MGMTEKGCVYGEKGEGLREGKCKFQTNIRGRGEGSEREREKRYLIQLFWEKIIEVYWESKMGMDKRGG